MPPPFSATPLYTEVDGVIDLSVNSRITIIHGMIKEPDQFTIYPTPPVGGVTFTLVMKDAVQIVFDVQGPNESVPYHATITGNHSVINCVTNPAAVSATNSGGPANGQSGYTPSGSVIQEGGGIVTGLVLDSGRLMVIGGLRFAPFPAASAAVDLWNPTSKQWSPIAPLPAGRWGPSVAFLARGVNAGKVLVAGGNDSFQDLDLTLTGANLKSDAYLYDFPTDTWTPTGSMTDGFWAPGTELTELEDGRVFMAGGAQSATFGAPPFPFGQGGAASNAVQVWDPATGLWANVAPMTEARVFHTQTLLKDGRVLVVGGRNFLNDPPNSVLIPPPGPPYPAPFPPGGLYSGTYEIYDPATNTWTAPAPLPAIQDGPTGLEKSSMDNVAPIGPLPGPFLEINGPTRIEHYAHLLEDGRVVIIGGFGELSGSPTSPQARRGCLIFDPVTNLCVIGPNMIRANVGGTHVTLRGTWIFVAGGVDESNGIFADTGSPTTQVFSPDDDSWRQLADIPAQFLTRIAWNDVGMCNSFGDVIITGGLAPFPDFFNAKTLLYNPFLPFVRSPQG